MTAQNWKLSPSDFAFLWEDCRRCFYLKVARRFYRPRPIMPKIFTQLDSAMKDYYSGKRTEEIAPDLPPGEVSLGEKWVESQAISFKDRAATCFVKGKFDTIFRLDDGTYGVIDFKTSQRKSQHVPLYSRQLHAYAYALENPAPRAFSVGPVTKLGLLVFEPSLYTQGKTGMVGFAGKLAWMEIPRNDETFMNFLVDVMEVLDHPEPPAANPDCEWCRYRAGSRESGL